MPPALATPRPYSRTRSLIWVWPVLVLATVFFASSRSQIAAPQVIGIDKVAHFFVFGLLGNLIQRALPPSSRRTWIAIVIVSLIGISDEWHQSFTPGRSVDFWDWFSDTSGATLAVSLYTWASWYRTLLETKIRLRTIPWTASQRIPGGTDQTSTGS